MSNQKKRIIIIGATSSIAEQCARLWNSQYDLDLVLVGRELVKLEFIAADLRVRNPKSTIESCESDFIDPIKIKGLVDNLMKKPADIVLIAHGFLPNQQEYQKNLAFCSEALIVNGVSPVLFAEAFVSHMEKYNHGKLVVIGSVAGDRGRKSNYIYGSAKAAIDRYMQGIQHRMAKKNVKIILVKPGPTDTPMTSHLKMQGMHLASPESVAKKIVNGVERGNQVIYAPAKWRYIMMILSHMPRFVFNRLNI